MSPPTSSGAGSRGAAAIEGRLAGPWSGSSESVTLSTSMVTVSASTGSSAIASIGASYPTASALGRRARSCANSQSSITSVSYIGPHEKWALTA